MEEATTTVEYLGQQEQQQEGINPVQSAIDGDIFPLVAAISHLDLSTLINPQTPLAHYICTLYIPLEALLVDTKLPITLKNSEGKTPLYFAIQAKDALATYYCLQQQKQFYQSEKQQNLGDKGEYLKIRSNEGVTPAMQALKSGFKIGFLLCVHFGYISSDLANIAAENNDIWTLKFLRGQGVALNQPDRNSILPLETAVANYSYQCIDYLGKLYPKEIKMDKLGKYAKSKTIFNNLKEIKYSQNNSLISLLTENSFLKQTGFLIVLFFLVNISAMFPSPLYLNLTLLLHLCFISFYFNSPASHSPNRPNILKTLSPFLRSELPALCPTCIQPQTANFSHCAKCNTCIEGFHFHAGDVCVSKCNQLRWVGKELIWVIVLSVVLGDCVEYFDGRYTSGWRYLEVIGLLWEETGWLGWLEWWVYVVGLGFYLKQLVSMVVIGYVVASGRTYEQVFHSQRYQGLYEPVLVQGEYYSRPVGVQGCTIRKGLRNAVGNTVKFIFG